MRRFATLVLSLSLVLGLTATLRVLAQDAEKKDAAKAEEKKADAPKAEEKKADAPKAEEKKEEAATSTAAAPQPIPPEVETKLEAARRAVAEAIVAAQDAGLVQTTIDPPPILDILITGRATDEQAIKARTGVSPEVFGAWFTGYGKSDGVTAQKDVRIVQPSAGLKSWYDQRATMLNAHIKAVRDAKGSAAPKSEAKKGETKKDETKKEGAPK